MFNHCLALASLLLACLLQTSCLFYRPIPPGAYSDGYAAGCDARKRELGYDARVGDARVHLQDSYAEGWVRGYHSCQSPREAAPLQHDSSNDDNAYCSKHQRKRGYCK
ncbi:hypothetical protein SFA35_10680 [Pseudomonas sp. HR96]|uniref:hypothetical protein n=1 Tax=Pseudomonas sp. HR96 TaxID=1027966 RepID=UPI002A755D4B|nr:hypothetical protein [Pseudomonas sp. HR96]WPP01778.1 hypothetical protein SFA35_10680 [Pseudomonas sp. HR96]